MKRIISVVLIMVFLSMPVFAAANLPEFLKQQETNYTANYSVTMTFDSSEEIVAFLEELEMPEEISYFVDMKTLLQSLLSSNEKMNLQVDFNENYDKIKMALTSEAAQNIVVNPNLNIGINTKNGIWMDIDLTNEEKPVFDIIYSYPYLNKYLKITADDVLDEQTLKEIKAVFNKDYIDKINDISMEIFAKYAKIQGYGNKYTVSFDNKAFGSYIDELIARLPEMMPDIEGGNTTVNPDVILSSTMAPEYPGFKDFQILGKDGIKTSYTLSGNRIVSMETNSDISINLAQIYTVLTGVEWPFKSSGKFDFTVVSKADFSKYGTTKVEFPTLTEENSFTVNDLMPDEPQDGNDSITVEPEPTPEYPFWYISESSEILPIIDGEIYVPLRKTFEVAYEDSVAIEFNNGVITVNSDYFPDFKTLTVTIGSDKVYADDKEYTVGNVILIDGTTFVSNKLFCDVFGWELTYAGHDLLLDTYDYTFITDPDLF